MYVCNYETKVSNIFPITSSKCIIEDQDMGIFKQFITLCMSSNYVRSLFCDLYTRLKLQL